MAKAAPTKKPKAPTKTQVLANLAEKTGLSKKEVTGVLEALEAEIKQALNDTELGAYTIPGLIKITRKNVAARPAKTGVLNQLTGQVQDIAAKPATVKVAVRALKALKDMVG